MSGHIWALEQVSVQRYNQPHLICWIMNLTEIYLCTDLGIGKDPTVEVDSEIIPLPNLSEPVLEKLIDWCTYHKDDPPPPPVIEGEEDLAMFNDEIIEWDQEFLKMEDSVLFDLILVRQSFV